MKKRPRIGILALQGAVREHIKMVKMCDAEAIPIKKKEMFEGIDGLIIPGGESTTIGKLMVKYDLVEPIKELYKQGVSIYGTCAGLILLAKEAIADEKKKEQPLLGLMDIVARRNAFGRQRESFEEDLEIKELGKPSFRAVFIRAPWIEKCGPKVKIMAEFEGKAVMALEDRILVSAFHPELTEDLRIHKYFIEKLVKKRN